MAHVPTTSEIARATRTAVLDRMLESIYIANHLYWKRQGIRSPAENAEYDLRQLQLKEILSELNELWRTANVGTL